MGKSIFIETLAIIELHIKSNNRTNLKRLFGVGSLFYEYEIRV